MRLETIRAGILGLASAWLLAVAACGPVPRVLDTPKDGDQVSVTVSQPVTVRWSNQDPDHGSWVLEKGPATPSVNLVRHTIERSEGAAFALDVFEFVGVQEGVEQLTFAYHRKDGSPPDANERITIALKVS